MNSALRQLISEFEVRSVQPTSDGYLAKQLISIFNAEAKSRDPEYPEVVTVPGPPRKIPVKGWLVSNPSSKKAVFISSIDLSE